MSATITLTIDNVHADLLVGEPVVVIAGMEMERAN